VTVSLASAAMQCAACCSKRNFRELGGAKSAPVSETLSFEAIDD
jgi:hypothetical protein